MPVLGSWPKKLFAAAAAADVIIIYKLSFQAEVFVITHFSLMLCLFPLYTLGP